MGTTTLLIGLGRGGSALMPYLLANPEFDLVAVCDSSHEAVGLPIAKRCQIPFFDDSIEAVRSTRPQLVIDATGDPALPTLLYEVRPAGTSLVTAEASRLLWVLLAALEGKRRAELRFDRLLADMSTGLVVIQDSRIRFVNPAFMEAFGYKSDDLIGHPWTTVLDQDIRDRDLDFYRKRLAGEPVEDEYETRILTGNGEIRQVMVRARRSDWDGRSASLLMLTDVTELRELERERERFFRFMVHEMRAPLSPLVTAVSLLRDPKVLESRDHLERLLPLIHRSTDRIRAFVDDFLELSKINEESLRVTREPLDLATIVGEIVDNQKILAEEKDLELKLEPWPPFEVQGDKFCVRTIVQNLVNNAIKYTDEGEVVVSVKRGDGRFTLSVADTGAGLDPDEIANLFQEFGRIQRMAGVKGTGLGLALVKQLLHACGGEIRVDSGGKGQGSTFTMSLPYVFGTPSEDPARPIPAPAGAAQPAAIIPAPKHSNTTGTDDGEKRSVGG